MAVPPSRPLPRPLRRPPAIILDSDDDDDEEFDGGHQNNDVKHQEAAHSNENESTSLDSEVCQ